MSDKTGIKTTQKTGVVVREKFKVKLPKNYRIVLLNNDTTAFDAVVDVLRVIFNKNTQEASQMMMHAHINGRALVEAPVTKSIGEGKVKQAEDYCRQREIEVGEREGRPSFYNHLRFEVEED